MDWARQRNIVRDGDGDSCFLSRWKEKMVWGICVDQSGSSFLGSVISRNVGPTRWVSVLWGWAEATRYSDKLFNR